MLLALVMCLAVGTASATEYVVDARAEIADDENPGTSERPFRTIQHAAEVARAGDTVIVRPGVYREAVILTHSGEPGLPITFRGESGAVVTGADIVTGWERLPGDLPIYRAPWSHRFIINHTPEGVPIEHHPEDAPVWGRAEQVIVGDRQLAPVGSVDEMRAIWPKLDGAKGARRIPSAADPSTWAGAFTVDTDAGHLYILLADGADPRGDDVTVQASARGLIFGTNPWMNREGVEHVHVSGFVFRYAASFPQRAAVWLHGRDNVLERCRIEEMSGGGVSVAGVMRDCVTRDSGHVGGGADGDGFLNENCLWEGNSWKPINRQWDAGGYKMTRVEGGVFRNCLFWENGGPGLWLDIDVANVLITECGFIGNELSGLFIEISHDITVTDSLFAANGVGRAMEVEGATWAVGGIQIAESMDCVVTGNTVVENKDGITLREQGPRVLDDVPFYNRRHEIVGNVCALNEDYQLALWYDNAFFGWHPAERDRFGTPEAFQQHLLDTDEQLYDPAQQGMDISHNLYWAEGGAVRFLYGTPWRPGHRQFESLDAFQANTAFGLGSVVENPAFEDEEGGALKRTLGRAGWQMARRDVTAWRSALDIEP
ncbi:DUF1565 domain-containing protein [Candidatus Poribacteria bacterium]|nr:DUF1565 domain-containing protein [Candidatus Poribacteria bacterium]MBT5534947.1 DUF1565 domain-containing protein [Candidatus Poribacteria bacterium]MBT5709914.1 DUF1565 domain-containing protein [Candidatus Poribacteria bacterium]MBT7100677.1 DUF1565 domain-containing protein [Candidatus Poribacteria bacterium]MBT7804359.1 DUF1565 domain-containing protein [Candidatus Poribacteria bacterium]